MALTKGGADIQGIICRFAALLPQMDKDMEKPFMISFVFKGKECFANVYTHEGKLKEYHIHVIDPDLYNGLPARIVLLDVAGNLHLSEPLNLSRAISQPIISAILRNIG